VAKLPRNKFPSLELLRHVFDYDPFTGVFTWRNPYWKRLKGRPAGRIVGGYVKIKYQDVEYSAGPLAWFYMAGYWPEDDVDHENRIRSDNRFSNLREATSSQNLVNRVPENNTSGYRGVVWVDRLDKWKATLKMGSKIYNLGYFDDPVAAAHRYDRAAKEHQGEFAVFNFPKTAMRDWLWVAS
jgi:hypothetical protein